MLVFQFWAEKANKDGCETEQKRHRKTDLAVQINNRNGYLDCNMRTATGVVFLV